MPDSNRDAGSHPLFSAAVGAGVGTGVAYGAQRGANMWNNRVADKIYGKMDRQMAHQVTQRSLGKVSQEKGVANMGRYERAAVAAQHNSMAYKAATGVDKVAKAARKLPFGIGYLGAAAIVGAGIGAISSD